jgi:DNA-binding response OmpR family regulator
VSANSDIKILVVEDDCLFRAVLEKRLGVEGYQVFGAADGREGMRAITFENPHLVLSDWMMPHVDGLELCQAIKHSFKESSPYFILLTARGQLSDRLLALETGADEYLVKPCDMGEILARVRTGVRIIQAQRSLQHVDDELRDAREQLEDRNRRILQLASLLPACASCGRVNVGNGHYEDPSQWLDGAMAHRSPAPCSRCATGSSFAA